MRRPQVFLLLLIFLAPGCCFNCAHTGRLLEPSCGLAALGFVEPGCGIASVFEPGCGIAGVLEPGCGIAGAYEPSCGIDGACACGEPSCGIDGVGCGACGEPSCGIASPCGEPSCGIAGYALEPSCGIAGPCGPFGGYGLFGGLWTGWGTDWQALACGWHQCDGPLMRLSKALRCGGCGGLLLRRMVVRSTSLLRSLPGHVWPGIGLQLSCRFRLPKRRVQVLPKHRLPSLAETTQ